MFSANENIQLRKYKKQIVEWVEQTMDDTVLDTGVNVMVMQVTCTAPGCVPLETVILIVFPTSSIELIPGLPCSAGGNYKTKILKPMSSVTQQDVLEALPGTVFKGGLRNTEKLYIQARDIMLGQITQLIADDNDIAGKTLLAQYLQQSLQDYIDRDCTLPEWGQPFPPLMDEKSLVSLSLSEQQQQQQQTEHINEASPVSTNNSDSITPMEIDNTTDRTIVHRNDNVLKNEPTISVVDTTTTTIMTDNTIIPAVTSLMNNSNNNNNNSDNATTTTTNNNNTIQTSSMITDDDDSSINLPEKKNPSQNNDFDTVSNNNMDLPPPISLSSSTTVSATGPIVATIITTTTVKCKPPQSSYNNNNSTSTTTSNSYNIIQSSIRQRQQHQATRYLNSVGTNSSSTTLLARLAEREMNTNNTHRMGCPCCDNDNPNILLDSMMKL